MLNVRMVLGISIAFGAAQLAGCMAADPGKDDTSEQQSALVSTPSQLALNAGDAEDPGAGCKQHFELDMTPEMHANPAAIDAVKPEASCPADYYFHPDNGNPGGWIEAWRLCNTGGTVYQICTGGSAPVRPYNPSSCNGTIYYYYPQGWHGDVYTAGGCC